MLDNADIYQRLLLALGVGLLIGFERGWQAREAGPGARPAGIRTFALIGLLGGLAGLLGKELGDAMLIAVFAGVALLTAVSYVMGRREGGDKGMTTDIAILVTFALGVIALRGDMVVAAAGAVITTVFLDLKTVLHEFLRRVQQVELTAALKLLLISVVLLPVLPDRGYGPGGIWNPYQLWWMVVLVSGISLAGHIAIRLAGAHRGSLAMGLLGGLASSTAVTVGCSRMARAQPELVVDLAAAIAAATGVMMLRTLAIALVLFEGVAAALAPALAAAAVAAFLVSWRLARAAPEPPEGTAVAPPSRSPENIGTAIQFAIVLAVVILVAHYARTWLGAAGLYATGALSGLVDVDAVTVSMTRLAAPPAVVAVAVAAGAILIASVVNSLVKIGIAWAVGGRRLALLTGWLIAAVLVAGVAAYVVARVVAGG